jgi:hypothetical protein
LHLSRRRLDVCHGQPSPAVISHDRLDKRLRPPERRVDGRLLDRSAPEVGPHAPHRVDEELVVEQRTTMPPATENANHPAPVFAAWAAKSRDGGVRYRVAGVAESIAGARQAGPRRATPAARRRNITSHL